MDSSQGHCNQYIPYAIAAAAIIYGAITTYKLYSGGCKSGRCNNSIRLQESKIVHSFDIEDLESKQAYCRCWKSKKFPYCDGSHGEHNKQTGDNVGPLIVQKRSK